MKGKYRLILKTNKLNYDITLNSKITVISDNSATGKTTFVNTVAEYLDGVEGINFCVEGKYKPEVIVVSNSRDWYKQLQGIENSIILVDELSFIYEYNKNYNDTSDKFYNIKYPFASYLKDSNNYFLFICRHLEEFAPFPIHYKNIYTVIHKDGKSRLKHKYEIRDNIVGQSKIRLLGEARSVMCEDSKSGFKFFNKISTGECVTSEGKDMMYNYLIDNYRFCNTNTLIVVDGCSFGSSIKNIIEFIENKNIILYLPESFEYLLLQLDIFKTTPELSDMLNNINDYFEEYAEESYTNLLSKLYKEYLYKNNLSYIYNNYSKGKIEKTIFFTDKFITELVHKNNLNNLLKIKEIYL